MTSASSFLCAPAAAPAAPPPLISSSWSVDPCQRYSTEAQALLQAIRQTQGGQSKSWLNVQPCVLEATATLVQLSLAQGQRLAAVEETVEQVRQVLEILLKDRQAKETRYQLDLKTQEEALKLLGRAVQDVQVQMETERQAHHDFQERVLIPGLRDVQEHVRLLDGKCALLSGVVPDQKSSKTREPLPRGGRRMAAHRVRRTRSLTSSASASRSASSASSCSSSSTPRGRRSAKKKKDKERLIAEVQQLREQWRRFVELQTASPQQPEPLPSSAAPAPTVESTHAAYARAADNDALGETSTADADMGARRATPLSIDGPVLPPQRARWCWLGQGGSHFPTPTRTSSAASGNGSPAIAWSELRLFDGRTDCWYSAGSCGDQGGEGPARTHPPLLPASPLLSTRWMCFTWVRPSVIRIERTGIYKVVACLVRDGRLTAADTSSAEARRAPSLSIEIDDGQRGVVVHHTGAQTNTAILYEATSSRSPRQRRGGSPHAGMPFIPSPFRASPRGQQPPQRPARASTRSPVRFQRECCVPTQTHTYTIHDYLFLSAGALLRVRCRNVHDTNAVYEAFLELEYIA